MPRSPTAAVPLREWWSRVRFFRALALREMAEDCTGMPLGRIEECRREFGHWLQWADLN